MMRPNCDSTGENRLAALARRRARTIYADMGDSKLHGTTPISSSNALVPRPGTITNLERKRLRLPFILQERWQELLDLITRLKMNG